MRQCAIIAESFGLLLLYVLRSLAHLTMMGTGHAAATVAIEYRSPILRHCSVFHWLFSFVLCNRDKNYDLCVPSLDRWHWHFICVLLSGRAPVLIHQRHRQPPLAPRWKIEKMSMAPKFELPYCTFDLLTISECHRRATRHKVCRHAILMPFLREILDVKYSSREKSGEYSVTVTDTRFWHLSDSFSN